MCLGDHNLTGCAIPRFGSGNAKNPVTITGSHVHEAVFSEFKVLEVTWILNNLSKDHIIIVLASNNIKQVNLLLPSSYQFLKSDSWQGFKHGS